MPDTLEHEDIHDLHRTDFLWETLRSYVLLFLNGVSLADLAPEAANSAGENANDSNPIYLANTGSDNAPLSAFRSQSTVPQATCKKVRCSDDPRGAKDKQTKRLQEGVEQQASTSRS